MDDDLHVAFVVLDAKVAVLDVPPRSVAVGAAEVEEVVIEESASASPGRSVASMVIAGIRSSICRRLPDQVVAVRPRYLERHRELHVDLPCVRGSESGRLRGAVRR